MRNFSVVCALMLVVGYGAMADPPPGPPGPYHEYYKSLMIPKTSRSCCDMSDCRPVTSYEIVPDTDGGHYEAWQEGRKWIVPKEQVLHVTNPTGEATLCRVGDTVLCFNPASEG